MSVVTYTNCPVCESKKISFFTKAVDYTVSKKEFEIFQCSDCTFKFTQNVPEQSEIGAYYASEEYISHSDTKEGLTNKLYHMARSYMLDSKKSLVEKHNSNDKILMDIGCGTGYFLDKMKSANWTVYGLETDPGARKFCKDKFDLEVKDTDVLFETDKDSVSVVTMWHVLEHVHQLKEYVNQIFNILKKDGTFVVAVPNCESVDAEKYDAFWAAWDVPRHLYHFSPSSMKLLMENAGFELISKKLMPFDSFYVSMLSEKYKNGSGNLLGSFANGLKSYLKATSNVDKSSSVIYVMKKR